MQLLILLFDLEPENGRDFKVGEPSAEAKSRSLEIPLERNSIKKEKKKKTTKSMLTKIWSEVAWVQILVLPFTSSVTLDDYHNLSVLQLSYPQDGNNISLHLMSPLVGLMV